MKDGDREAKQQGRGDSNSTDGLLEGSSRKYNPCGTPRNHSNSDKLGKAEYQALAVGIFCRDCEHPYNPLVGGRGRGYP